MTSVRVKKSWLGLSVSTFVLLLNTYGESQVFGQVGGIVLSNLGDQISASNVDVTGSRAIPSVTSATVSLGFDLAGMPVPPDQGTAGEAVEGIINNLVVYTGTPPNLTKWNDLKGDTQMMPVHITLNAPKTVKFYTLTSANDSPERDPHRWRLLGSTLANPTLLTDFTLLDERDGVEYSARHQTQLFGAIPNNTPYLTYRFEFETEWVAHMTGVQPNSIQLAEVELFENFAGGGLKMEIGRGTATTPSTMTLISAATTPLQILGYSILSNGGTLNSNTWRSITDNGDGNSGGTMDTDNWIRLTDPNGRNDLSEVEDPNATNGFTLNPGATFNLGDNVWIKQPTEDVTAEVLLLVDGQPLVSQVSVTFTGAAAYRFGDLNFDRAATLNTADWVAFKNGQGFNFSTVFSDAESYAKGDLDGDQDHDLSDFVIFKSTFDAANGAGAFEAMLASIPEPTTAAMLVAGAVLATLRPLRRRGALILLAMLMLSQVGIETTQAQTVLPGLIGNDLTNPDGMGPAEVGLTAGGTFPANEQPPQAVDSNTATKWLSLVPAGTFYQIAFSSGGRSAVNQYTITSANDAPERDPYSWTFGGSNDGTTFTTLDTRTAIDFDARFQTRQFNVTNTTQYAFYRFDFQTPFGAGVPVDATNPMPNSIQLAEIELFGTAVTSGLVLEVNAATGNVRIVNSGPSPIALDGYEIRSAAGSLNRNNWWGGGANPTKDGGQSIHDQTIANFPSGLGNGNGWEEGPGSTDNEISEWFLGPGGVGSSTLQGGESITMNGIFRTGGAQDLTFDYRYTGPPYRGTVSYIGAPVGVTGDYNGNGTVDAADYVQWRNGGPLQNDPTNGVQPEDYGVWCANFGKTAIGAGAGLGDASAVPEPAGWLLALLVPGLLCAVRWRRAAATVVCQNRDVLQPIQRRNAMANIMPKTGFTFTCLIGGYLLVTGSAFGSTLDRNYRLGDDTQENATVGQTVGQASVVPGSTLDSASQGSFFDLMQIGGPTYVNPQATGRPGAVATNKAVQFTGSSSQHLFRRRVRFPARRWRSGESAERRLCQRPPDAALGASDARHWCTSGCDQRYVPVRGLYFRHRYVGTRLWVRHPGSTRSG